MSVLCVRSGGECVYGKEHTTKHGQKMGPLTEAFFKLEKRPRRLSAVSCDSAYAAASRMPHIASVRSTFMIELLSALRHRVSSLYLDTELVCGNAIHDYNIHEKH